MSITAKAFLCAALCATSFTAQSVYKCQGPDGRIVYSDRPCQRSNELSTPDLTNAGPQRIQRRTTQAEPAGPLPPIDFGNTPTARLNRAGGIIASIKVDARECDWDLQVTKTWEPCVTFLKQLMPGRQFTQAKEVLSALIDDAAFLRQHQSRFREIVRDIEEIQKVQAFAQARLDR